ncbi:aldo/keto reductase [Streptomyces sp. NPDC056716]|uniref:aldo/keto reductase n=1 Tax=unclassified Streptomyces TaxID=2593676 RepID=UPI00368B5845
MTHHDSTASHDALAPDPPASRRHVLKAAGGLAAAFAVAGTGTTTAAAAGDGEQPAAPAPGRLITKMLPGTGERLPAIGLGTFTVFDSLPGADTARLHEVVRRFWAAGGRVIDTSPLYGAAEANTGAAVAGFQDQVFLTDKIWATGEHLWDESHALASLERSMERLSRGRPIDVMQVHNLVNVDCVLPMLHAWKKEGRIRALGVTHHEPAYFGVLADWVERGDLDFIQVHYSIRTREAERRVLPACAANGVAVMANMPLEKARLHKVVEGRPLPGFAAEAGAANWAQFFLKWVIAHPAVTCALPGTSDPDHMTENAGAMRGELPDRRLRERMARHMESLPGFDAVPTLPWFPDKAYPGPVSRAQSDIRARSPWWPSAPTT